MGFTSFIKIIAILSFGLKIIIIIINSSASKKQLIKVFKLLSHAILSESCLKYFMFRIYQSVIRFFALWKVLMIQCII